MNIYSHIGYDMKKKVLFLILLAAVFLFPFTLSAQEGMSANAGSVLQAQNLSKSGGLSSQQVQEGIKALEEGKISPETARSLAQKAKLGTLSQSEIEQGKKLLEQVKKEKSSPEGGAKAEATGETHKQKGQTGEAIPDEEFFKKVFGRKKVALPIFGHKLFSSSPSTFAPIKSVPVSESYLIGPGDEIKVLLWGRIDATYSLVVNNEGVIEVPKIGPLSVAGLTFGETKQLVKQKIEAITGVKANVSMGVLRTIQIFVLGEVKSPGLYTVSSLATAVNALLASGGPTSLGSLRKVQVKRGKKIISTIDLYDFLLRGDTTSDSKLMPGDVIFVPQVGPMIRVGGNVKRPAIYELSDKRTLRTALKLAGGLNPGAYDQRIQIERAFRNKKRVVLDISYDELKGKRPIPLNDGDSINVFSIIPSEVNAVYLFGNVLRPGKYAFKPGLKVLDLIPDLESLRLDTYFAYALIKRYRIKDMKSELIPFDLGRLLKHSDMTQNIPLRPLDEVYVFNKRMFEDREYATVKGQVRRPGRYFIDGMCIKDLILKAGDLKNDAYLSKGELVRIDKQRNKHTLYFDVKAAMQGDPENNIPVQNEDTVIIHSVWEKRWKESVTIKGEVKDPGNYEISRKMTLKDLFFKAGGFTRDAYMEEGHLYRTNWQTKEVTIHTFNVAKALEGDPAENFQLQDLDQVVIHSTWEYVEKYSVFIDGMVHKPGEYPYATNMTVRDLILVAGNVKYAAYMKQAELVRYRISKGNKVVTSILKFDVKRALKGDPANNFMLRPLDVIHIKEIPNWWGKKKVVTISGEVRFPGQYQIREDERLSSVIERAGGFTRFAYLRGAVFTRESVKKIQEERLHDMMKRLELEMASLSSQKVQASLSAEDLAAQSQFVAAQRMLISKLKESKASGRVVVSLLPPDDLKKTQNDVVLEDKDSLYVPPKPHTVNILGAVYNPTSLVYMPDRPELKYYLQRTGGATDNAQEDQMYVIRTDGTVISKKGSSWFGGISWDKKENRWGIGGRFENTKLFPGDTVLVPQKIVRPSYLRNVKDITSILYQIAVTAGITITQVF